MNSLDPARLTRVELYVMFRETMNRVGSLLQCAREGKRIDESSSFCRWLLTCGVIAVLKRNPERFPLIVDGVKLEKAVKDLLDICGEYYAGGKVDPEYSKSDIDEIRLRLDELSRAVGQPVPSTLPS